MKKVLLRCLCIGASFACATSAFASDMYDDPFSPGSSTLLELGRYQTDFDYPTGEHEAHVGRYGIGYNEAVADDFSWTCMVVT